MNNQTTEHTTPAGPTLRWSRPSLPVIATALVIIVQLVAIYLFGGSAKTTTGEDPSIVSRLQAEVGARAANVDFSEATSFAWDRMYVFAPYTARAAIDRALGVSWSELDNASIESRDDVCLVVFVRSGEPVIWYMQPRTIDLEPIVAGSPYRRSQAVFRVVTSGKGKWRLEPRP